MSKKGLSRREFLRLSAITTSAMALAGTTPQLLAQDDGVAIQYWVFWNQYGAPAEEFGPLLNEAVAPNTVEITTGVGINDAYLTAVAAGTPPDIGASGRYSDYMANGQVVPIDDLAAASEIVKQENFAGEAWDTGTWQGVQYGVSSIEAFVRFGLNYNARMVEEAGLDPDDPPQTWEDLLVWHEALTQFDDAGNLLQIGLDPTDAMGGQFSNPQDGSFASSSFGINWWDPDTRTIDFTGMAEAYDMYAEFIKIVGPDNLAGFRGTEGQGSWGPAYDAEVQAMIIEGYWHPGETSSTRPDVAANNRATWAPVPASRAGTKMQMAGGHMVFFWKDAQVPANVAWPVAEFLLSDEHCNTVFDMIGWLPAYIPFLETADPEKFPGLEFYFNSVSEANEWWPTVKMEIMSFISTRNAELRERVYRGEMTGAEAEEELQRSVLQEWEEAGF